MKLILCFLACVVLGSLAARADVVPCLPADRTDATFEVWQEPLPAPDYLDGHAACVARATNAPRPQAPASPWLENQRRTYADALKKQRVDILVAPFQNQGYGLERTERALISADLAYHIDSASPVAEPFLTARALGEGARRYERDDIVDLARAVGASTVVVGYVGHDRQHRMTVTIEVLSLDKVTGAAVETVQRDWRHVPFTHAEPPFVVFHRMLPSVLESLQLPIAERPHERSPLTFPAEASFSVADLASARDPLRASVGLSLLGAMTGSADERTRERLFTRALLASWHFDVPSTETAFLRAYALLNLEHRPAALALINGATGAEFVALRALLNGNLPTAAAAIAEVRNPFKRLMLAVHVDDLRYQYQREEMPAATDTRSVFGDSAADWSALAQSRSNDANIWHLDEARVLKVLLDETYSVAGLGAPSVIGGGRVVGTLTDDIDLDIATMRHVGRFVETVEAPRCCTADSARATVWDVVSLVEGRTEARVSKYLSLTTVVRSALDRAAEAIERYRTVFEGHPLFALAQSDQAFALSEQASDDTLERLRRERHEHASLAAALAGGQNRIASRAVRDIGISSPEAGRYADVYGFDYPRRAYWPDSLVRLQRSGGRMVVDEQRAEGLPYVRTDVGAFQNMGLARSERDNALVLAELEQRFAGHPSRAAIARGFRPSSGDPLADARAAFDENPEDWNARFSLGRRLIEDLGRWEEAAELLGAHPHFHNESPPQRVRVSNDAYTAGSIFYWGGHQALAIPLYEVAAKLQTGADSQLASEIRLNTLAGRYSEAAAGSYVRAQRYPDADAFRDFLSFLHALGYGEEAWEGFSQVATAFESPQIWVSALVGQRLEGLTEAEIRAWLKRPGIRDARFGGSFFAPRYAVLVNASDHETPEDLGALVADLEGEPAGRVVRRGAQERPHPGNVTETIIVTRSAYADARAIPPAPNGTRVKSEFAFFGTAYAAIRHGRFDAAVDEFKAMSLHYAIETEYSFALPYFAWAAAKTGDDAGLEKFMDGYPHSPPFDANLARAFFHGARKETERARELLDKALRSHPYTDYRPVLVEYQYAEACEWLYQETGEGGFIDALLAWVVSQQEVQPTHAWAYAMEYTYARTPARKLRALAMTLYLDPESPRIRAASASERAEAEAWGAANNPFLQDNDPPSDGGPTARVVTR